MILYCKAVVEIDLNITASVNYRTVGKVFYSVSWTSWHVVWHPDFYNECESAFICSIHWATYALKHIITSNLFITLQIWKVETDSIIQWGRVAHISTGKLTVIGSDNVLSSGHRQAIIWTNVVKLQIGPLGTNFSEILIGIQTSW